MFRFSKHMIDGLLVTSLLTGCGWLNNRGTEESMPPGENEEKGSVDPSLPYFSVTFRLIDHELPPPFTIIPISPPSLSGNVWKLDDHRIAIRKIASDEKIFFAVDFGDGYEVGQFAVERSPLHCTNSDTPYLIAGWDTSFQCGPNQKQKPAETIVGQTNYIEVLF